MSAEIPIVFRAILSTDLTVTSEESNSMSDGVKSTVSKFTTPGPGERIVAYPP